MTKFHKTLIKTIKSGHHKNGDFFNEQRALTPHVRTYARTDGLTWVTLNALPMSWRGHKNGIKNGEDMFLKINKCLKRPTYLF